MKRGETMICACINESYYLRIDGVTYRLERTEEHNQNVLKEILENLGLNVETVRFCDEEEYNRETNKKTD